jgi:hypothetical protein
MSGSEHDPSESENGAAAAAAAATAEAHPYTLDSFRTRSQRALHGPPSQFGAHATSPHRPDGCGGRPSLDSGPGFKLFTDEYVVCSRSHRWCENQPDSTSPVPNFVRARGKRREENGPGGHLGGGTELQVESVDPFEDVDGRSHTQENDGRLDAVSYSVLQSFKVDAPPPPPPTPRPAGSSSLLLV